MKNDIQARRTWLSGIGAALGALALGSSRAQAQSSASAFQPTRHAQDDWLDALPGKHRTFIDSSAADGAADAMLYANNLHLANASGYGLTEKDLAIVVCFRHASTVFGFNDAMWAKYGKNLGARANLKDPKTQDTPTVNLLNVAGGGGLGNRNITIDQLTKQGVRFAICAMATRNIAGLIATATGGTADAVVKELMANSIPNSTFVPAGVVAATRAQERGYALLRA